MLKKHIITGAAIALIAACATAAAYFSGFAGSTGARPAAGAATLPPFTAADTTSRADLERTIAQARRRVAVDASDARAGLALADALLRQARVASDGMFAIEAEKVLNRVLAVQPGEYSALKMLGAVYFSQHRFREAADAARRAMSVRKTDAWSYGVLGDALLEQGDYAGAFDAFDTMVRLRPDAASYARVAYAHEIQGRLDQALRHMTVAAEATSAQDPESLAWHHAQLGNLHFQAGRLDDAAREYARADFIFPGHPYARLGQARIAAARGNRGMALVLYAGLRAQGATPEIVSAMGDLKLASGDRAEADTLYAEAERLEREGWKSEEPQPAALARMLAERDLKPQEAVTLAERAANTRSDIFTMDALAVACLKAGRLQDARAASVKARRTGTADRRILYHAAAIEHALGNDGEARLLIRRAIDGNPTFDPLIAPKAVALAKELGAVVS